MGDAGLVSDDGSALPHHVFIHIQHASAGESLVPGHGDVDPSSQTGPLTPNLPPKDGFLRHLLHRTGLYPKEEVVRLVFALDTVQSRSN